MKFPPKDKLNLSASIVDTVIKSIVVAYIYSCLRYRTRYFFIYGLNAQL